MKSHFFWYTRYIFFVAVFFSLVAVRVVVCTHSKIPLSSQNKISETVAVDSDIDDFDDNVIEEDISGEDVLIYLNEYSFYCQAFTSALSLLKAPLSISIQLRIGRCLRI